MWIIFLTTVFLRYGFEYERRFKYQSVIFENDEITFQCIAILITAISSKTVTVPGSRFFFLCSNLFPLRSNLFPLRFTRIPPPGTILRIDVAVFTDIRLGLGRRRRRQYYADVSGVVVNCFRPSGVGVRGVLIIITDYYGIRSIITRVRDSRVIDVSLNSPALYRYRYYRY